MSSIFLRFDPGAGHLLTFCQFAFIALVSAVLHLVDALPARPFSRPLTLPLRAHMQMAVTFFALSVVNNKALDYRISMPLHMIFRSSSLITSLLVGALLFSKRYRLGQWVGCLLVSLGILLATLADALAHGKLSLQCCGALAPLASLASSTPPSSASASASLTDALPADFSWLAILQQISHAASTVDVRGKAALLPCCVHAYRVHHDQATWLTGVGLLTLALLMTSGLSFVQEKNFKAHGKNWKGLCLF